MKVNLLKLGGNRMNAIERTIRDVVIANRILALYNVLDAYGHVSMRHPERHDRYFLARSISPAIVDVGDVIEFNLDGTPVDAGERRGLYVERFIHSGVYETRADAKAVLHSHADDLLPFSISKHTRLRPVIQNVGTIGHNVLVWDIADNFGDETTLLVTQYGTRTRSGPLPRLQRPRADARTRIRLCRTVDQGTGAPVSFYSP
jgi:ribulose-5-phosphate 4-epimerase/fuculose-1-phosphate aldolase